MTVRSAQRDDTDFVRDFQKLKGSPDALNERTKAATKESDILWGVVGFDGLEGRPGALEMVFLA